MLEWLTNTEYSEWVTASWGWPFALTIHAFGNATVVGLIFIIGMRLFGLFQTIPYTSLNKMVTYIWAGVAVQAYSGFTLWAGKPARYLSDGMFDIKVSLVLIGVALTWFFHNTLKREAAAWEAAGTVSSRGVKLVAATAIAWAAVLVTGRLTAYLGTLYAQYAQ